MCQLAKFLRTAGFLLAFSAVWQSHGFADLRIGDICRYKGQEENTLHGIGLVVGLKGTGDGDFKATNRSLGQVLLRLGGNPSLDVQGKLLEKELSNAKNVAMVLVQATIPAQGVIQGDRIDCRISTISAKSIEGGNLILTHMVGPRGDAVYGLANGPITIDDPKIPTTGRIVNGCKMEQSVLNPFVQDNKITLVLHPTHCSFATAQLVADGINHDDSPDDGLSSASGYSTKRYKPIATAIDQAHIVVNIPEEYRENPVEFVSQIERIRLVKIANKKRVYINQRNDVIIIGEDVTIAPVAVSYGSLTVNAQSGRGNSSGGGRFVEVQPKDDPTKPKLKNLVDALNVLNVPTKDIVAIIQGIHKQGNLYGEFVIE